MKYVSTRDAQSAKQVTASQAIVNGLAPDGGLYVPVEFPKLSNFIGLPYEKLALEILKLYLTDFSEDELKTYISAAYSQNLPVALHNEYIELFHGRTAAFKDVALQLYPHLLTASLRKNNVAKTAVVLVATSGDTGSAVIAGMANVPQTRAIVFYPHGGVSEVQKLQMATQEGDNIKVFAIQGNFDDAQSAVKSMFENDKFRAKFAKKFTFTSANSINLARLIPQIVYYFYSYSQAVKLGQIQEGQPINFSVPTGNFGNILAGYYAGKMGLPIHRLICATNSNDVLHDFIQTGKYDKNRQFHLTISPSMDILISSNLERLIHDLHGSQATIEAYQSLKATGTFTASLTPQFTSERISEEETLAIIKEIHDTENYILDPHTAVAKAAQIKYQSRTNDATPTLILATASPYKFAESIEKILPSNALNSPPESMKNLSSKPILHTEVISIYSMEEEVGGFLNAN